MKRNFNKKLLGLTLAAVLVLFLLAACGSAAAGQTTAPGADGEEGSPTAVGAVLLSVNPEIVMSYDETGRVVSLTGRNEDGRSVLASYTGYEGRECDEVLEELVARIHQAGYFDGAIDGHAKNIVLKLERGSRRPSDDFLEQLAQSVRRAAQDEKLASQTVALDDDDYDDSYGNKGYISAQAAQELLAAQLGREDLQFVEKEYDLEDGTYELEFLLDGVKYEYEVDAVTGKVLELDVDRPGADRDDDRADDDTDGDRDDREDLYDIDDVNEQDDLEDDREIWDDDDDGEDDTDAGWDD